MNIFSDVYSPPQHFIFFSYFNILHWYYKHDKVLCSVYVNLRQENDSLILIWTTCWRENLQYILMIFCRGVWLTLSAPSGDSRLVTAAPPAGLHTANWILVLVGFFRSNGQIGKSGSCEIFLDFFFNDIPNHSIFHTLHWNYILI